MNIKDGMLSGTVEISAMGMMLSNYFQGISSKTTRTLLMDVNTCHYVDGECVDGGKLDQKIKINIWNVQNQHVKIERS